MQASQRQTVRGTMLQHTIWSHTFTLFCTSKIQQLREMLHKNNTEFYIIWVWKCNTMLVSWTNSTYVVFFAWSLALLLLLFVSFFWRFELFAAGSSHQKQNKMTRLATPTASRSGPSFKFCPFSATCMPSKPFILLWKPSNFPRSMPKILKSLAFSDLKRCWEFSNCPHNRHRHRISKIWLPKSGFRI